MADGLESLACTFRGEVRTFKLPNDFLRLAADQTTTGFHFAKTGKLQGKRKPGRRAPAAPKVLPKAKKGQKFHFFGNRG